MFDFRIGRVQDAGRRDDRVVVIGVCCCSPLAHWLLHAVVAEFFGQMSNAKPAHHKSCDSNISMTIFGCNINIYVQLETFGAESRTASHRHLWLGCANFCTSHDYRIFFLLQWNGRRCTIKGCSHSAGGSTRSRWFASTRSDNAISSLAYNMHIS